MADKYDLNVIYNLSDHPDINGGRCDNCNHGGFSSYIQESMLIRKCKNCGMKKIV